MKLFGKSILTLVFSAGLVKGQGIQRAGPGGNADISLTCERAGNPCMQDPGDPRFDIIALMVESSLRLREYELDNNLDSSVIPEKVWTESQDGWNYKKMGEGTPWEYHHYGEGGHRALGDKESNLRGREREARASQPEAPELGEHQGERELFFGNACSNACINAPQSFVCVFYCGGRRRRLDNNQGDTQVCTQQIHLREFLRDYPTTTIDECIAKVACTLTLPCTA